MNRRKFLKMGALSISGVYLLPRTLTRLAEKHEGLPNRPRQGFRFMGRSCEPFRHGVIKLPERFDPGLIKAPVHFLGSEGKGYLTLIPANESIIRTIHKDLKRQEAILSDVPVYLGSQKVSRTGKLNIPKTIQEFVEVSEGEIIVAGIIDMIEIWDKETWNAAYKEAKRTLADVSLDI